MNFRQNGDKYLITIEVIALIVVLVFGAVHFVMPGNKANKKITESQQETQNSTQETDGTQQVQADGQQAASAFTPSDSVKTKLSSMTTEEKVAQLFITRPEEITGVSQFTQAGNKTKAAIGTYPLGGFVFRQENFSGEAAVTKMMSSLQSFSQERLGVNLFLAIDEEGGERLPLASANGYEAQQAPSQLGDADAAGSRPHREEAAAARAGRRSKEGGNPRPVRRGRLAGHLSAEDGRGAGSTFPQRRTAERE